MPSAPLDRVALGKSLSSLSLDFPSYQMGIVPWPRATWPPSVAPAAASGRASSLALLLASVSPPVQHLGTRRHQISQRSHHPPGISSPKVSRLEIVKQELQSEGSLQTQRRRETSAGSPHKQRPPAPSLCRLHGSWKESEQKALERRPPASRIFWGKPTT